MLFCSLLPDIFNEHCLVYMVTNFARCPSGKTVQTSYRIGKVYSFSFLFFLSSSSPSSFSSTTTLHCGTLGVIHFSFIHSVLRPMIAKFVFPFLAESSSISSFHLFHVLLLFFAYSVLAVTMCFGILSSVYLAIRLYHLNPRNFINVKMSVLFNIYHVFPYFFLFTGFLVLL